MGKKIFIIASLVFITTSIARSRQSQTNSNPAPVPGNVWHMKLAQATDVVGDGSSAGRQMVAYTMLIPTDWTSKLGVYYPRPTDCNMSWGQTSFTATSPDHLTGINVLPIPTSAWSDNQRVIQQIQAQNQQMQRLQKCSIEPLKPFGQSLTEAAKRLIQGGQLVGSPVPVPVFSDQIAAAVAQLNSSLQQQAGQQGSRAAHVTAEFSRQRFNTLESGSRVDGWVIALQIRREEPLVGGGTFYTSETPLCAVMIAPQGKLDAAEKMMNAMLMSVQYNPEWQQSTAKSSLQLAQIIQQTRTNINRIYQDMAEDNARTARRISQIRSDTKSYASNVQSNVAHNRAAALDHSSQQFSLYMGD